MSASTLTGTGLLTRVDLRRDRVVIASWTGVLLLMVVASAATAGTLYPDEATRVRAVHALNDSPAIVALYGPILDPNSIGELAMTKLTVLYAVFVAMLLIVVVRRHTRVEEESGRTELVGGTAVGRDAPLAAALVEAVGLSLTLGGLAALGNAACGLDVAGSVAFGALWAGTGLVAAGIAALTSQISASARTCAAWAAGTIAVLYVLRAVGDTGPQWLSWLSPFGWNTQVRAWSGTRWWLLLAYPALAAVLVGVATVLRAHRDLGSGLVAARPGPAEGSPRLADALALALKVHATAIVLWSVGVGVLGVVFGAITPGLSDLLDSLGMQDLIAKLGGYFLAAILSVVSVVISYFAVTVVAHTGRDEEDGRTEVVLATTTSRSRWFGASVVVALGGTAWLLVEMGIALWIGYVAASGPGVGNLLAAALAWVPAAWVTAALAALCFSVGPRWTAVGWVWPGAFITFEIVGELLEAPRWVLDLSPYQHVPAVPAEPWDWPAETGLAVVAALILVLAWWRFRARDIG
ncbi:MAG TPA: hypothetical protein VNS55_02115 [Nocardioides sp.]|nr:hypothetical protein [Nocardioides sp.]